MSGCASGAGATEAPPAVDVTGAWTGTWSAAAVGAGSFEMTLRQSGAKVIGDMKMSGTQQRAPGGVAVDGVVSGHALWFSGSGIRGELTVKGDETSGLATGTPQLMIRLRRQR